MRGAPPFVVNVLGASARTPLGLEARQTALLCRAKKGEPRASRFRNHNSYSIGLCTAPGVPSRLEGLPRWAALAAPALRSIARTTGLLAPDAKGPVPLILAVPEPGRPDDDAALDGPILKTLAEAAGVPIDEARSRTVRAGHAGFAVALSEALDRLSEKTGTVLVGGVDSYHHEGLIAWLDKERRVHAMGVGNGFVPGEGAAFLALGREGPSGAQTDALRRDASPGRAGSKVRLAGVESRVETAIETGAANIGKATTEILAALAPLCPGGQIPWLLSDVNGERHRVREHTFASMRGALATDHIHSTYTNQLGDSGAASGAVLAAIACELFSAGAAPHKTACVTLASDGSARGGFLLTMEGTAHD